jgi:hypothetical protein
MWKYAVAFVVIFGFTVYVSRQTQQITEQGVQQTAPTTNGLAASNVQESQANQDAKNPKRNAPFWFRFFTWPEGVTAWAILLTLLAIAEQTKQTSRAAEAAEASVKTGMDTAKRQLRAYMVMRNSRLILHEDGFVEAKMELANCGQTPAYDLRGATLCRFTTYPIQGPKQMPDNLRQSQSTIGAGLAFYLLPQGGRHDGGDREHLLRKLSTEGGNLVYCVNGYFTYKDIFQDPHWIKFQMIVGGPGGVRMDSDVTHQWASFSNDSEGNEEDH